MAVLDRLRSVLEMLCQDESFYSIASSVHVEQLLLSTLSLPQPQSVREEEQNIWSSDIPTSFLTMIKSQFLSISRFH
jgi:hypothetical protein